MNIVRTISQSLLIAVLCVGNVSAFSVTTFLKSMPYLAKDVANANLASVPVVVALIANNFGKDKAHNKAVNTLGKTCIYAAMNKYSQNISLVGKKAWVGKPVKALGAFALCDAALRYVVDTVLATDLAKNVLPKVKDARVKKALVVGREFVTYAAASYLTNKFLANKVTTETKEETELPQGEDV